MPTLSAEQHTDFRASYRGTFWPAQLCAAARRLNQSPNCIAKLAPEAEKNSDIGTLPTDEQVYRVIAEPGLNLADGAQRAEKSDKTKHLAKIKNNDVTLIK